MIWITWENQRRSIELSKELAIPIYVIENDQISVKIRFVRYIFLGIKTFITIAKEKPRTLFVQNPSIVLAMFSCVLRIFFKYKLIVDRHSNFKFDELESNPFTMSIFNFLSNYTLKNADLTIVTNQYLAEYVRSKGGKAFVLEDKLPTLKLGKKVPLKGKKNIIFISTFSNDEPIEEVVEAASYLPKDYFIYITGGYKNYKNLNNLKKKMLDNIILTGFLPEEDYQSILYSSDLIVVLTKHEYTLTCGAYEGLSIEKVMVLSNTQTIRAYFNEGVVYADATAQSIANAIKYAIENFESLKENLNKLNINLQKDWAEKFKKLLEVIRYK